MAPFRGLQEYIALDANNIALVFDSVNIVSIEGNIFLYLPQGHRILYNYLLHMLSKKIGAWSENEYVKMPQKVSKTLYTLPRKNDQTNFQN